MLKFSNIFRLLATLWIVASLSGCANRLEPNRVTLALNQSPKDALAVRFEEVRFNQIPMTTALMELSNVIFQSPSPILPRFQWEGPGLYNVENTPPLKDPKVSLSATNVSLGIILDSLCSQAEWSYHKSPKGIKFDGIARRSFTPERR
jgi:hypothetical protein